MTPPRETARLRWSTPPERQSFRTLHLYLPGPLLGATMDEYRRIGRPSVESDLSALAFHDETVVFQAKALLAAHRAAAPDLYAAGAARWLVTHWIAAGRLPRTLRIAQAKLMLRTTDLPVSEVARCAGYPRADAFTTAFQRHIGSTPSEYRLAR